MTAAPSPPWFASCPADPDNPAQAKKAEKVVAACFVLAMLAGFGFLVAYAIIGVGSLTAVLHSNLALGGLLSLVFLLLGIGATIWVRHLMPDVELHRAAASDGLHAGGEARGVQGDLRRRAPRRVSSSSARSSGAPSSRATIPLAIAPLFLLRDLGPLPGTSLDTTVWRKGLRLLVYGTGRPITAAEFNSPGSIISVGPEGYLDDDDAMAKAAVTIIKFRPGELVFGPRSRPGGPAVPNMVVPNWTVDNIVAYSKICTHVGCPAALYEQTTHHILCPCHQSTFDATQGRAG